MVLQRLSDLILACYINTTFSDEVNGLKRSKRPDLITPLFDRPAQRTKPQSSIPQNS